MSVNNTNPQTYIRASEEGYNVYPRKGIRVLQFVMAVINTGLNKYTLLNICTVCIIIGWTVEKEAGGTGACSQMGVSGAQ